MSTDLTPTTDAALPAMYQPGTAMPSFSMSDIVLPRLTLVSGNSQLLKQKVADDGDVVWTEGADDENPYFLIGGPEKKDSFVGYVVAVENFAATTTGGGMTFHPDKKRDPDDSNSWEGFFYSISIPELDPMFPARLMLWKTAGRAPSKQLNTMWWKNIGTAQAMNVPVPPMPVKFRLVDKVGFKSAQPYKQFTVGSTPGDPDDLKVAAIVMENASKLIAAQARENEGPAAVSAQPSVV